MVFRSAVDWWFYAVIVVSAVIAAWAASPLLKSGEIAQVVVAGVIALLSVGLPVWLLVSTSYRVHADVLEIRSGPFLWTIAVDEISKVRKSRSALSSPALSLDRLEVSYGGGKSILVSPRDRDGFLKAIRHSLRTE